MREGLSQRELGVMIGVRAGSAHSTVHKIETGQFTKLTLFGYVMQAAHVLGIPDELVMTRVPVTGEVPIADDGTPLHADDEDSSPIAV